MHRDSYHHLEIHDLPPGGLDGPWAAERLANARAALLHRLDLTSARLRARGLRLRLEPEAGPEHLPALPAESQLGVTLYLDEVSERLVVSEALYLVESLWRPFWQGRTLIHVEDQDRRPGLPADLQRRAGAWLRLERGTVEVGLPVCIPERQHP